jgi:hypothetical protein
MGLFTKKVSLPASTWLRAISYVQEDAKVSIDRCTFSSSYEKYLKELVQILLLLLRKYDEIQTANIVWSPHKLYSIKVPRVLCDRMIALSQKRLSDEEPVLGAEEFNHQQLYSIESDD